MIVGFFFFIFCSCPVVFLTCHGVLGRMDCTEPPLCSDLNGGPAAAYLNQAWVQERLGFWNVSFELIDFDLNERWTESKNAYVPTTRELTWLLDNTHVRILFINGNNDIIVYVQDADF